LVATTTGGAQVKGPGNTPASSLSSWWSCFFILSLTKCKAQEEKYEQWGEELFALVIFANNTCNIKKRRKKKKEKKRWGVVMVTKVWSSMTPSS